MPDYTIRPRGAVLSAEFDLHSFHDGGSTVLDISETDWGLAQQPEPVEEVHAQGASVFLPLEEVWRRRTIRLVGAILCSGLSDKTRQEALLRQRLMGQRTIRRQGWEIDVTGISVVEQSASKATPRCYSYEATFFATPPFWRHVYSLQEIQYGAHLYPDFGVPPQEAQPAFLFGRDLAGANAIVANPGAGVPHFTLSNWGTAFCYPAASITGAPPNTDLYFKGLGRYRVKVRTNGSGAATLREADRFYLASGDNPIRLEDVTGAAISLTSYGSMRIDFGATKLREL